MNIIDNETIKSIQEKLSDGVNTLMMTKRHLDVYQEDVEAAVMMQLKSAKSALKLQEKAAMGAMSKREMLIDARKTETIEAVAEWKAKRELKKLLKRAERAEEHAEACVTLAMYYAAEAQLAILSAIAAYQDTKRR